MSLLLALAFAPPDPPDPDEGEFSAAGSHDWRKYTGVSAEVARYEQAKRVKQVEVAEPIAEPEIVEPAIVAQPVTAESIQEILAAWERLEQRQALQERQAQAIAEAEIARIRAMREEELMIVTMMMAMA
jgi:hypothetical protein